MVILIADKKDFYDITDLIPILLNSWEADGITWRNESDAIQAFMQDANCHQLATGETYLEAVENLMKVREKRR
ncbi:hypothetical protein ACFRCQ_10590 [Cytobacillus firmus]|uniref:hypothetical protein n=1 Tax=Cytobacillus firmus TaxID=1399 RepID=UPI003694F824